MSLYTFFYFCVTLANNLIIFSSLFITCKLTCRMCRAPHESESREISILNIPVVKIEIRTWALKTNEPHQPSEQSGLSWNWQQMRETVLDSTSCLNKADFRGHMVLIGLSVGRVRAEIFDSHIICVCFAKMWTSIKILLKTKEKLEASQRLILFIYLRSTSPVSARRGVN
jgi:hypothetical protein